MLAKDHKLVAVLQERQQWVIPVYQRTYTWDTRPDGQLPGLWDDLKIRAEQIIAGETPSPHFVGAIIYAQPEGQPFGAITQRFLVDGQQRITTFSLALCAMREVSRLYGFNKLISTLNEYLLNAVSDSMDDPERERFKLWSSAFDRKFYIPMVLGTKDELRSNFPAYFYKNGKLISGSAPKIIAAYWYLLEEMTSFVAEGAVDGVSAEAVLNALVSGFLSGFQIVVVQLSPEDDAQGIFGSLNGSAAPLTNFDLIRNDIFHRAARAKEDENGLYNSLWKELETEFWKAEVKQGRTKRPRTDHLISHALIAQTARDIKEGQTANEYRRYADAEKFSSVKEEVETLLSYARAYANMERREEGEALSQFSSFLHLWDTSALHPIVLWTTIQNINQVEKESIYEHLEAYIVRRDVCNLSNKHFNKFGVALLKQMHEAKKMGASQYGAFHKYIMSQTSETTRMPSDAEMEVAISQNPLYHQLGSKKLRYIFDHIERSLRSRFDESVTLVTDNLTVEHILPDAWARHWPLPDGRSVKLENYYELIRSGGVVDDAMRDAMFARESAKHTLGNLTLLTSSLNPSVGNQPWPNKKERIGQSLLALNRHVSEHGVWDESAIKARSLALCTAVNRIWAYPSSTVRAISSELAVVE